MQRTVDQPLLTRIAQSLAVQHVKAAQYRRQQVIEIMRHAAGKLPHRLQLLRLSQRFLRLFKFYGAPGDPFLQCFVQFA